MSHALETGVGARINAFAVDLYRELARADRDNLVVSPASISIAFAMTHAGARGQTASELAEAFRFGGTDDQLYGAFGALLADWGRERVIPHSEAKLQLALANRLFGDRQVPFEPTFLALTRDVFGAELDAVDFRTAAPAARERINVWVEHQTRDRIKQLLPVDGVTMDTRLVLVNAVYFKAPWANPFLQDFTSDKRFVTEAGIESSVPTMRQTERHGYAALDGLQVLEMSYGDRQFSLVILLPKRVDGLANLEADLTPERLESWVGAAQAQRVRVELPRFKIEPGEPLKLSDTLRELGVRQAFDAERADFTKMAPAAEQLLISEAFHKAFIDVNEKGTEAAAATAVAMMFGGMPPADEPPEFRADHPFLYLLRDTRSGAILFMGRVTDPSR